MKLNTKEIIAGFPILKIRDLLKKNEIINNNVIKLELKVDEGEVGHVITVLEELRYIQKCENSTDDLYEVTLDGNRLALAKAVPPLNRVKADKLFSGFMQRVHEVNMISYYLYKVERVLLFGSYITNVETVNDIDLAVELQSVETDTKVRREMENNRIREALQKGIRFSNSIVRYNYPRKQVLLFLKSKSRYLSIHGINDEILNETMVKQVYPITL